MSRQLTICLPRANYAYPIHIGQGLLGEQAAHLIRQQLAGQRKLLVVTHQRLWDLFGAALADRLTQAGFAVYRHDVSEGETAKSLDNLHSVWLAAQQAGLTRRDAFVALGGGVIGDLTGFAAASYYRGVPFIQIPTTLLAQVDSSVGGKTGINVGPVKNSVGAFYQPVMVLIDPAVLSSLPVREITAGLAEVLKYGLIESSCTGEAPTLWKRLSAYPDRSALLSDLDAIIDACCVIKAAVVAQDETEQRGLRALLNLGHTFGHALEADGDYTTYLHGEAVAIGVLWAYRFAYEQGIIPPGLVQQVELVWQRLGMPNQPMQTHTADALLARMRQDKKNAAADAITLILPTTPAESPENPIGYASVCPQMSASDIYQFLKSAV